MRDLRGHWFTKLLGFAYNSFKMMLPVVGLVSAYVEYVWPPLFLL